MNLVVVGMSERININNVSRPPRCSICATSDRPLFDDLGVKWKCSFCGHEICKTFTRATEPGLTAVEPTPNKAILIAAVNESMLQQELNNAKNRENELSALLEQLRKRRFLERKYRVIAYLTSLVIIGFFFLHTAGYIQASLGDMYANGRGIVTQNDTQAVHWFREAAGRGRAGAQNSLGWMYEHGRGGLTPNNTLAIYWYRKAAEQGHIGAQANLDRLQ